MMIRTRGEDDISEELSHALDEAGVSESEIKRKRTKWLQNEQAMNSNRPSARYCKVYLTGSRIEGLALPSVKSDNDCMFSIEMYHIISKMEQWQHGIHPQFLTDNSSLPPGYTKLRLVNPNEPVFVTPAGSPGFNNAFEGLLAMDQDSLVMSRKFCFPPSLTINQISGPANKTSHMGLMSDIDMVLCVSCQYWPEEASEWMTRQRSTGWPSTDIIQQAKHTGCHLVPKCSPNSYQGDIEWSYSFSLVERLLIHSWSNKLCKCLVILKTVKSTILKNIGITDKVLSSYHMKTIIFWLTEKHGVDWWEQYSLAQCVFICLYELQQQIRDGFSSHYFIREINLFENISRRTEKAGMFGVLSSLLQEGPSCLNRYCILKDSSDSCSAVKEIVETEDSSEDFFLTNVNNNISYLESILINSTDTLFLQQLRTLKAFNKNTSTAGLMLEYAQPISKCHTGSSVVSYILSNQMPNSLKYQLDRCARRLLEEGTCSDVASGKLKLASYYYIQKEIETSVEILEDVAYNLNSQTVPLIVSLKQRDTLDMFGNLSEAQAAALGEMISVSGHLPLKELCQLIWRENICLPVFFNITERHGTPKAIVFEMFRQARCTANILQYWLSEQWGKLAAVDAHIFTYFLQFMCYKKLGMERHVIVALDNLKWTAFRKPDVRYGREAAVNLVGYCYLQLGNPERATQYFVRSIQRNHLMNSAYIHLAVVLSKIRHHLTPIV